MKCPPQAGSDESAGAKREEFADGSALFTFPDGTVAIIESVLAQASELRESGPVTY